MVNNCIVCNSTSSVPFYPGILKCQQCGHVVADLQLSDHELFELYKKDYFFGDEYSDYVADKQIIQKNFQLRLNTLKTFLKPNHTKLFEIGCAYGFFIDVAQSRVNQDQGIDINTDGIRYARDDLKLDGLQLDLLKHEIEDKTFEVD